MDVKTDPLSNLAVKAKKNNSAFQELSEHPDVKQIINYHAGTNVVNDMETEDIRQELYLHLFAVVRCYDIEAEVPFKYFLNMASRRCVITLYHKTQAVTKNPKGKTSLDADVAENLNLHQILVEDDQNLEQVENVDELKKLLNQLKPPPSRLEMQVLILWAFGYSYEWIAEKLKVKQKAVDNAIMRIKRKKDGRKKKRNK